MITTITLQNGMECFVDTDVWESELKFYSWRAAQNKKGGSGTWYVRGWGKPSGEDKARNLSMHRMVIGAPSNLLVDHIDGNGLNNTRANLRMANNAQNQGNRKKKEGADTSKYKGVYKPNDISFHAMIGTGEEKGYLGAFKSEAMAALCYDKAAIRHYKEFALTNFPVDLVQYIQALESVVEAAQRADTCEPHMLVQRYIEMNRALATLEEKLKGL